MGSGAGSGQHPGAGSPADPSRAVQHIDVLKSVKQPQSLKDREHWERFSFQVETYLALLDPEYPSGLEDARKAPTFLEPNDMTDACRLRGKRLFAMLTSWTQEMPVAVKIARGIREQNGFELWRLLWREMAPDNHSKSLIWRRSLLSPKFPGKEAEFSCALQEWEADLEKYGAEYGPEKAISDEDKRAVVLTEAPTALKQHLSMHIGTHTTYRAVREVVVSYLQAKRVWVPSAAYAGGTARRDPDAMDIGKVGDDKGKGKGKKGKGKEQKGKGKGGDSNKGGKGKDKPKGSDNKDRCPICWKTGHTVEKCWFNSKGNDKGKGKGHKVSAVTEADGAESTISAGPSASQVGGNASVITLPSSSATTAKKGVRMIGDHRLLMVKAQSKDSPVSQQAILAMTPATLASQQEVSRKATLAQSHFGVPRTTRLA